MAAREPVFNFSERFVLVVSGVLAAIWLLSVILPAGLVYEVDRVTVLKPLPATRGVEFAALLGHGLRHAGLSHLLFNIVGLIWFGTLTMRGARSLSIRQTRKASAEAALLIVLATGVIVGGLAQWVWWSATGTTQQEMVGASGGVSALLAVGIYAVAGRIVMLRFAIVWALINVLLVLFPEVSGGNAGWPAHIGGYVAGMGLAARMVQARSSGIGVT